jgi:hypothetical protein
MLRIVSRIAALKKICSPLSHKSACAGVPPNGQYSAAWLARCGTRLGWVLLQVAPQRVFRWGILRYR